MDADARCCIDTSMVIIEPTTLRMIVAPALIVPRCEIRGDGTRVCCQARTARSEFEAESRPGPTVHQPPDRVPWQAPSVGATRRKRRATMNGRGFDERGSRRHRQQDASTSIADASYARHEWIPRAEIRQQSGDSKQKNQHAIMQVMPSRRELSVTPNKSRRTCHAPQASLTESSLQAPPPSRRMAVP